jgi:hypothetical protein
MVLWCSWGQGMLLLLLLVVVVVLPSGSAKA